MARGKKTVVEKIADVVDHVIHPADHSAEKMIEKGEAEMPAKAIEKRSSDSGLDYAKHPKFHKFISKDQGDQ